MEWPPSPARAAAARLPASGPWQVNTFKLPLNSNVVISHHQPIDLGTCQMSTRFPFVKGKPRTIFYMEWAGACGGIWTSGSLPINLGRCKKSDNLPHCLRSTPTVDHWVWDSSPHSAPDTCCWLNLKFDRFQAGKAKKKHCTREWPGFSSLRVDQQRKVQQRFEWQNVDLKQQIHHIPGTCRSAQLTAIASTSNCKDSCQQPHCVHGAHLVS